MLLRGDAVKVVAGSASVELARELTRELATSAGAEFVEVAYEKHAGGFPDGERYVRVLGHLEGERVLVVATTYPDPKIVELLLLLDAVGDLRPKRVTLVIPYFGYGRQDKRFEPGEALSARVLASHLSEGANEVLVMGLHNPAVLKFFDAPAREVSGIPAIGRYLRSAIVDVLLAPDANAIRFAKEASAIAGKPYDHLEKERIDSYTVKITPKALAVRGKSVAIVDDVISTGGTIATAAKELRAQGARRVIAACVHGLFVGPAEANLKACEEVIATDTVLSPHTKVSVAPEFAAAIRALS